MRTEKLCTAIRNLISEFCTYYLDELESSVLDRMMEESDVGSAEIEEYYSNMEEPLYTDGEKVSYYLYTTDGSLPM